MMLSGSELPVTPALPSPLGFCFFGADLLQKSGQIRINQGLPFREHARR